MAEKESQSVTPWNPFADLEILRGWSPFRAFDRPGLRQIIEDLGRGSFAPALDIAEDEQNYLVTIEVPGVKKDDIHIELEDGMLTIRGEKRSVREEKKEEKARYVERRYGSFTRSFTLPRNADQNSVKASFEDGVLTLEVPKTEESKAQTIAIK